MSLAHDVVRSLLKKTFKVAFAESCTGGMLSSTITSVPGSSSVFDLGLVTYANSAKVKLLNVSSETLALHGAVSHYTALEMVTGLKNLSQADICVSVTGIAGPGGGTVEKPVGLVYVGYYILDKVTIEKHTLKGTRQVIRKQIADLVLKKILQVVECN